MNGCVDYLRHEILWRAIQCQCKCLPAYYLMDSTVAAAAAGRQIARLFANMESQYLRRTKKSTSKGNRSQPAISSNSLSTRTQFQRFACNRTTALMRCAPSFPFVLIFISFVDFCASSITLKRLMLNICHWCQRHVVARAVVTGVFVVIFNVLDNLFGFWCCRCRHCRRCCSLQFSPFSHTTTATQPISKLISVIASQIMLSANPMTAEIKTQKYTPRITRCHLQMRKKAD